MPLFKFVGRGSLLTAKQGVIPTGGTVEMSEEHAASMPPGLLEPIKPSLHLDSGTVKPVEKPLLLVAPPAAPVSAVRPTHSHGSKRVKDTKP
jgi:hypothetical protein